MNETLQKLFLSDIESQPADEWIRGTYYDEWTGKSCKVGWAMRREAERRGISFTYFLGESDWESKFGLSYESVSDIINLNDASEASEQAASVIRRYVTGTPYERLARELGIPTGVTL